MKQYTPFKKQKGISVVIVIFLLAVVSALAVSMVNVTTTQHFNTLYSAQGSQAYFAARAGLDYAISRINGGAVCGGINNNLLLGGYAVNITCQQTGTYDEGNPAAPYNVFLITSIASRGGFQAPDQVTRQLRATIRFP